MTDQHSFPRYILHVWMGLAVMALGFVCFAVFVFLGGVVMSTIHDALTQWYLPYVTFRADASALAVITMIVSIPVICVALILVEKWRSQS